MSHRIRPVTRRPRVLSWCAAAAAAVLCALPAAHGTAAAPLPRPVSPQPRADGGSELLNEPFTGSSVADPGFQPLNSVCLTGAAGAPPAGQSSTGPCTGPDQTVAPVPAPGQTPGWLQLTDQDGFRKGGLLYNRPLPGNGGLQVTFDQYQYGGSGADGIGFYLVDGGVDLTSAGGDGGSLGYAQRNLDPGVDGGYLGIGLDAYGNFVNDGENRGKGCPDDQKSPITGDPQVKNTVTLRGPGQGIEGYCYLASTIAPDPSAPSGYVSTLPGSLREGGTTPDPDADPNPAKRTVRLTVSAEPKPLVTVEIDFQDGQGLQQVLSYRMTTEAPPTYKFGFSGSTGGFTDTHLIRGLTGNSVTPLSSLNLVKTDAQGTGATYHAGDTVHYNFLVTNTSADTLTGVTVTDPGITDVRCPRSTLGPMGTPTASMECTGSHLITGADANAGRFTNTAAAHGTSTGGATIPSNNSTVTVDVVQPDHRLAITKTSDATGPVGPGDTITYTVTVKNTGDAPATDATVTDDLSDVLDDATYNDDAKVTPDDAGTVSYASPTLTWTGDLAVGATATVTYSVTVDDPSGGDGTLTNTAVGPDRSNCPADPGDSADPDCTSTVHTVVPTPTPTPTVTPTPTPTHTAPPTPTPTHSGPPLPNTGAGFPVLRIALAGSLLTGLGILFTVWSKRPRKH